MYSFLNVVWLTSISPGHVFKPKRFQVHSSILQGRAQATIPGGPREVIVMTLKKGARLGGLSFKQIPIEVQASEKEGPSL